MQIGRLNDDSQKNLSPEALVLLLMNPDSLPGKIYRQAIMDAVETEALCMLVIERMMLITAAAVRKQEVQKRDQQFWDKYKEQKEIIRQNNESNAGAKETPSEKYENEQALLSEKHTLEQSNIYLQNEIESADSSLKEMEQEWATIDPETKEIIGGIAFDIANDFRYQLDHYEFKSMDNVSQELAENTKNAMHKVVLMAAPITRILHLSPELAKHDSKKLLQCTDIACEINVVKEAHGLHQDDENIASKILAGIRHNKKLPVPKFSNNTAAIEHADKACKVCKHKLAAEETLKGNHARLNAINAMLPAIPTPQPRPEAPMPFNTSPRPKK